VAKSDPNLITTLIGAGCEFEGNMSTSTSTRIDGKLNGKITGENTIIIGENGLVLGEIKSADTVVYGRVEGVIETHSLEIKRRLFRMSINYFIQLIFCKKIITLLDITIENKKV